MKSVYTDIILNNFNIAVFYCREYGVIVLCLRMALMVRFEMTASGVRGRIRNYVEASTPCLYMNWVHVSLLYRMDGWMGASGWMDGWMDGLMDGWMDGWVDG